MANTLIQIKNSLVTASPPLGDASVITGAVYQGELAYSYQSGNLFIGNTTSNGSFIIGGKYFTDQIDSATSSNTANKIVERDASGNFSASIISATLDGNAATASKWATARAISVSGDATGSVNVDGSAAAAIPLTLAASGVTAGAYGSAGIVPVVTVDTKGRVTSIVNVAISSAATITATANAGSGTFSTALSITGNNGIKTTFDDSTDTFNIYADSTFIRTTATAPQTIGSDLTINGNLTIIGTQVFSNTTTILTTDSLIKLAANNFTDSIDIGFYGQYGASPTYTGLVRQAGANYFLFRNLLTDPTGNILQVNSVTQQNTATLRANITGGTVSSLAAPIALADGGTGVSSFANGGVLRWDGTNSIVPLANVSSITGSYDTATTFSAFNVDVFGRVTSVTTANIALSAAAITSGTLPLTRGGTGVSSFANGGVLRWDGTNSIIPLANVSSITGSYDVATTFSAFNVDVFGRVTGVTTANIALSAAAITSGILPATRGGTGASSFASGSIVKWDVATSSLISLANVTAIAATYDPATTLTGLNVDAFGRVTGVTSGNIAISALAITSGTLPVTRGGTGIASYTANGVIFGGVTSTSALLSVASATEGHLLTINTTGIPTFAMLSGGTF